MPRKPARWRNLTEAYVRSLKPEAKRYEVYDRGQSGLLVRVTPTGAKSFGILHRVKGGPLERITVGRFPKVSVKLAREQAKAIVGQFATGKNPAEDRRHLKSEMTLEDLWAKFLKLHAKVRKRSWETDQRRWNNHLASHGQDRLSGITTAKVTQWLTDITAESGPITANRVRALLFTMFEKGRKEWGLPLPNPVQDTPRNPETSKERYLLPEELRRFLRAAEEDPDPDTRDFLKLALFTGQRRGALCRARWSNINLRDGAWAIPAEDMKAGKELLVPLAPPVVAMLKERGAMLGKRAIYVFPSPKAEGPMPPPRTGLGRVLKAAGVVNLTFHDCRRTFATWAQDAGAPLEVIARLLGHTVAGGVTAVYARVHFDQLRRWAERTVDNMIMVANAPEDGKVLRFPGTTMEA